MNCLKGFIPQLKDHLLGRILNRPYNGDENDFSTDERRHLYIIGNCIHEHSTLRINYTTYDVHRDQDTLNPRTHADIMMLSHDDDDDDDSNNNARHPFWYARIIKIFHVFARYADPSFPQRDKIQRFNVLWIRWFGREPDQCSGWANRRLHRIGFVEGNDSPQFGFLDPLVVIRGVHLIPAFAHGRTSDVLGPSIARHEDENDEDWQFYYVGQ